MLRIAIIGCGKIADQHVQAIRRIDDCTIVGLCDRELLMARQLGERFGINACFSDVQELLETTTPDVVHISTPPPSHYPLARECLDAERHVYLEKPFTVSAKEAESLIELAECQNVKITAGHNLQFTPEILEMRHLVQEGFLSGKPVHLESYFSYDLGDTTYAKGLLGNPNHWVRKLPGQLLHNIISHGVAKLAEFLDDDLIDIIAVAGQSPRLMGVDGEQILDELRVLIRDKSGTTAFFCFSTQIKGLNQVRIYGPAGSITADTLTGTVVRNPNCSYKSYLTYFVPPLRNAREHFRNARRNVANFARRRLYQDFGMKELIERFYNSIQSGSLPPIPYREIILTARIMDKIFAQIYPGRKTNGGGRTAEGRRQMADDARQPPTSRLARDKEDGRQMDDVGSVINHQSSVLGSTLTAVLGPRSSVLPLQRFNGLTVQRCESMKYVLITPAHNEEAFIEKTLDSMVGQTLLPERWIIVDDGSSDRTADIIQRYARRFCWIQLMHRAPRVDRNFAGKVQAFNAGLTQIRSIPFDVIGNLDADLSFEKDYLEFLIGKFAEDPRLGVAGTPFTEDGDYDTARDSFEGENHVAGGCQLFRRRCFEEVGGYIPNPAGGVDWIAVTTARMKGWLTRSFPEKRFHHYRTLGTAGKNNWAASFSYGEKDYYLGGSPLWQLFRVAYRTTKRPTDGLALLFGYCWAAIRRAKRPVSMELMRFHRREQIKKLRTIFWTLVRFEKVNSFRLAPGESHTRGLAQSEK